MAIDTVGLGETEITGLGLGVIDTSWAETKPTAVKDIVAIKPKTIIDLLINSVKKRV